MEERSLRPGRNLFGREKPWGWKELRWKREALGLKGTYLEERSLGAGRNLCGREKPWGWKELMWKREALGLEGNYLEERRLRPGRNLMHGGRSLLLRCYGREVGRGWGWGALRILWLWRVIFIYFSAKKP